MKVMKTMMKTMRETLKRAGTGETQESEGATCRPAGGPLNLTHTHTHTQIGAELKQQKPGEGWCWVAGDSGR